MPLVGDDRDTFMTQLSEAIEIHYRAANTDIPVMDNLNFMPELLKVEPADYT